MKILRKPAAAAKVGANVRTLERWASDPKYAHLNFPKLVPVGPNISGFVESEIDDWIASRAGLRDGMATQSAEA